MTSPLQYRVETPSPASFLILRTAQSAVVVNGRVNCVEIAFGNRLQAYLFCQACHCDEFYRNSQTGQGRFETRNLMIGKGLCETPLLCYKNNAIRIYANHPVWSVCVRESRLNCDNLLRRFFSGGGLQVR